MTMTEVIPITHSNEGVRVTWPNGTADVFANAVTLAEAYVRAMRAKEHARRQLVCDVAKRLSKLSNEFGDEQEGKAMVEELQTVLCEVVTTVASVSYCCPDQC